jgi:hypothetical protein
MAIKRARRTTAHEGLVADLGNAFQLLAKSLFDDYRPEQHYMRGPGPKWHAKHDHPTPAGFSGVPAFLPVRVKR